MMKIEIVATLSEENIKDIALECAKIMGLEGVDPKMLNIKTYTTKEVAGMLNKSQATIQRHCEKGLLEATKPSKSWIITLENLNTYIKNQ